MRSLLLDSVILVDVLSDVPEAVAYVREAREDALISATARAEVLAGLDGDDDAVERASALLDAFPCLPVTLAVADRAARLSRTHHWPLPVALQAAVALENSLTLATRNTDAFRPSTHDFVTVPYSL